MHMKTYQIAVSVLLLFFTTACFAYNPKDGRKTLVNQMSTTSNPTAAKRSPYDSGWDYSWDYGEHPGRGWAMVLALAGLVTVLVRAMDPVLVLGVAVGVARSLVIVMGKVVVELMVVGMGLAVAVETTDNHE
ncbi:hypothetical protein E3N88_44731 [Mikania micrantha]|uniref:Uncharacterized protein n=1 Tax=Mikania micrantha TaxID=192012 RepID=A0A5N6LB80_9ASTR|nr:hypothetical protein E3N88_44731 [Mikania micrantha]